MNSGNKDRVFGLDRIDGWILMIREHRVILDSDLACLYGVSTKALNQAIKRNLERFPPDFMFRLSQEEKKEVVTNCDHLKSIRFSHSLPFAFTEHGSIMAASVLNSRKAIEISVFVVRAFVRIRHVLSANKELAHKLGELERRVGGHDAVIRELVSAIRRLAEPPPSPPRRRIGFHPPGEEG